MEGKTNWWEDPEQLKKISKQLNEPITEEYRAKFWEKLHHNEQILTNSNENNGKEKENEKGK